ncbi:PAP2-domain-containing protein [Leucogyrophana mollusca]|uniref:PAP2-domain-containing protein n=1 Tax=Leucogyrophana mollusca TaxID=85980 RepID=A0ACB8BL95_9AGAM|nr:PAP2-domain-containing protein [Leucogyrophana mollusca]
MIPSHNEQLPLWLKFLDETSKVVTSLTAVVLLYTRSAGVAYFGAGALSCACSAKLVKRAIRQERPVYNSKGKITYGMPSTHASACTFYAVYVPLACLYLPRHPTLDSGVVVVLAPLLVVPWTSMIVMSRVWLGHHTWSQVLAGTAYGIFFAAVWFRIWLDDFGGVRTLAHTVEEVLGPWIGR